MKCYLCEESKLSKEFPFYPLTKNCNHPLLHCLDCATASVKKNKKCSQCEERVTEDNEIYKEYLETLDFLFPPEEEENNEINEEFEASNTVTGEIYVTTMSGESVTLSYYPHKKIFDIKREIESKLKTPPEKQRLLYHNNELKVRNEDSDMMTLKDYKVLANSTVHLIIVLWAVPDELDNVVFDFCWGLPRMRSYDYLDVSVFVYSGQSYLGVIWHRRTSLLICPGVVHSGPAGIVHLAGVGRQKVTVNLKSVPSHVDKLVFTLSAWAAATISEYPYYKLNFYDVNFPNKQLCSAKVDHLKAYKSVIMCCLSKKNGRWEVIEIKEGSDGFTRNYSPLRRKIERLMQDGYF